jgi:hypothetical protein
MSAAKNRLVLLAVVLAVAAGALGWLLLASGGDDGGSSAAPAATPTTSQPAPPTPVDLGTGEPAEVPQTVLAGAEGLPPALPPVALGDPTAFANGVFARLVAVDAVDAAAHAPGEIAGPALAVTVELTNDGAEPVSLDSVAVNVAAGPDGAPAAPIADGATAPLAGALAPGDSARATYVFTVPVELRDVVVVTVSYGQGAATAVFSGPAA